MTGFSRSIVFCALCATLAAGFAAPANCATREQQKQAHSLYVRALLDEYAGNMENAFDLYSKIMELEPEAYSVQRQAVRVAFNLGRMERAEEWARQLVKVEPAQTDNWMLLGAICAAKTDMNCARSSYEKAVAIDPANNDALYQSAQLFKLSDPALALSYLKKYMEAQPEAAPMALYEMALITYKTGDFKKTGELLNESLEKDPDFLQSRYAKAQLYEVKNDTAAALAEYAAIENRDPMNAALLSHVGEIYAGDNREAAASSYFKKTLAVDPSNPTAAFWLAVYAEHNADYKAAGEYIHASANYDKDPSLWLRYSYYLTQTGRYNEAVLELETAYKKWPEKEDLGYFLALGLDDINQTKKAVEILKNIVAQKPDYRDARQQYAIMAEKTNDIATAEEQFKILLKAAPQDATLLNYLGYSLADRGMKLDEAQGYIKQAVALAPDNGAYLDSLGWVYFKKGHLPEAFEQLQKAAGTMNTDDTLWLHLGDVFAARGDAKNAWLSYHFSHFIKPDQKSLAERIAKAEKQIPSPAMPGLYSAYFNTVAPRTVKYSALCRLTASGGFKSASFDAIVSYSSGALSLDLTGPMFTPVIGFRLEQSTDGKRTFSVRQGGGSAGELDALAERILSILYDYYSGQVYAGEPQKVSGSCLQAGDTEVCMDKAGLRPQTFTRKNGGKVSLNTIYEPTGNDILPETLELKSGGLKVLLTVTRPSQELEPARYWVQGLGGAPWDKKPEPAKAR